MIKCQNCGKEHEKSTANCCWIDCDCGEKICGNCGSTNLGDMIEDGILGKDDETDYWCCTYCKDCGLQGCAMCI